MMISRDKILPSKSRALLVGVLGCCVLGSAACGEDLEINASSSAVIEANVEPESDCDFTEKSRVIPRGVFDIGGQNPESSCQSGYVLNLRVRNRNSTTVVFNSAEVRLQNVEGQTIMFERRVEGETVELPNPLKSRTASPVSGGQTGVVSVLVVPQNYGPFLNNYAEQEISATIVLRGQAESGENVGSRPFTYPIELCDGCLKRCFSDVEQLGLTPDDFYGDQCADNAGADDRICIDTEC
jgi:hypothetical protein